MNNPLAASGDGSHTVYSTQFGEHYHSMHGAVQESRHVFINAGLKAAAENFSEIKILEMGFGTGLNCLLTLLENDTLNRNINYCSLEAFPLDNETVKDLNYTELLASSEKYFSQIHTCPWEEKCSITEDFTLLKRKIHIQDFTTQEKFNLVYYDAFSPTTQPELWTEEIFAKLFSMMEENGLLVTYCSKGSVKRNLKQAGFSIETLPGPPGKREMTRAIKRSAILPT